MKHCTVLYQFASRYAGLQSSLPHVQPSPQELRDMSHRAKEVVRLLEEYRRAGGKEFELFEYGRAKVEAAEAAEHPQHAGDAGAGAGGRAPKRPWEEMAKEEGAGEDAEGDKAQLQQTMAEQDMEIIRTKRATSTAGAGAAVSGQPKSKYRKRSVSRFYYCCCADRRMGSGC